jgi:ABC-type multidrug transport system ATPase subunit
MTVARLILKEGSSPAGNEFVITQLPLIIGRIGAADYEIDDRRVSRKHAQISRQGNQLFVEDLGSRNGTYVNGRQITAAVELRNGDLLELGNSALLKFEEETPAPELPAEPVGRGQPEQLTMMVSALSDQTAQAEQPLADPPQLQIALPGGQTQTHLLAASEITVGRSEENDITVKSQFMSRKHMRLVRVGDQYELHVDPNASNPVFYLGSPLAEAHPLADGDEFQLAPTIPEQTVTFRYVAPEQSQQPEITPKAPPIESRTVIAPSIDAFPEESTLADRPVRETTFTSPPPELASAGPETIVQSTPIPFPARKAMLVISIAGQAPQIHDLEASELTLGRSEDNDIVVRHNAISRHHARLQRTPSGHELSLLPNITNPTFLDGQPITGTVPLLHGTKLRIDGTAPGEMISFVYLVTGQAGDGEASRPISFGDKSLVSIGRDEENDITLTAPTISRFHAQVERVGQRYRIRDLRSSNGTYVNGEAIEGDVWLKPDDTIRIGTFRFVVGQDEIAQFDESRGMRVEATGLHKWVRKDLNILQNISLLFDKRELVVVVGQSGGGKSTLVDAIAGYRPATHGQVRVNGVDVYRNFDAIRHSLGYVPQKDIIHMELTVFQALDYAAQLRMPPDTTVNERHQRVAEVLDDLDLAHRKDVQISGLSGGQQKRVSIGVELLTKPGLFFLDEPTSGLDPGTETSLMQLMRRLADQGRTIVLITHATKNVMLADKVIFLARGGYLAWFGPPDEALAYFDQHRSERERRTKGIEFDDIYNLLDNPDKGNAKQWARRYAEHAAHEKYIAGALRQEPADVERVEVPKASKRRTQVSALRQFFILSSRNLKILTRDRFGLLLMLLAAPLIATLDFVLASGLGKNPFSFENGDMNNVVVSLNVLTNNAILVAGLSQMRELVKEREIYRRERLVNLRLLPYIMSKLWVAGLLALYQSAVFVIVHNIAFEMPGDMADIGFMYVTIALLSMAGMLLGLFTSALAPTASSAPLMLILFLIPQIVLNGALVPLPEAATTPVSTRWAFQAIMASSGVGSDVAGDVCWDLTREEQDLMTSEQKEEHCSCMGVNALREGNCGFPGLGDSYDPAIDEPDPVEPEPAGADAASLELFQVQMAAYQTEVAEQELARGKATSSAEARIRLFKEDFEWTFVDKDGADYNRTIAVVWGAQVAIMLVLFVATIVFQKRRDVA